jgi:GDP-mannose 6-dehydrogenase
LITGFREAESVKYVNNSWHAVKVAFTNEVSSILSKHGCSPQDVMSIFSADKKLNLSSYYMKPGFSYGGSCLAKDLSGMRFLAKNKGLSSFLLDSVDLSNQSIIQLAFEVVVSSSASSITIVGITFKSNTDDLRNSPLVNLILKLLQAGYEVKFYDESVQEENLYGESAEIYKEMLKEGCVKVDEINSEDFIILGANQHHLPSKIDLDLTVNSTFERSLYFHLQSS